MDSLHVAIGNQTSGTPFGTDSTLLEPTKSRSRSGLLETIDPHAPSLELLCDTLSAREVFAPDTGSESGIGVIGSRDDFCLVGPRLRWYDGALVKIMS